MNAPTRASSAAMPMQPLYSPQPLPERPALRVLLLAWCVAVSQTPLAALAWIAALALGLLVMWRALRDGGRQAPLPTVHALREDLPAPAQPPTRRRTDASSSARQGPPLLPAARGLPDTDASLAAPQQIADTGEAWSHDLQARGLSLCVLHVGLEGVDAVVSRYGAEAGLEVLRQVGKRLRKLARDEDRVMRFDDHEFVLLLACPQAESLAFVRRMADRIKAELQRPVAWRTISHLDISGLVGSAVWPQHGQTLDAVLEHAAETLARFRRGRAAGLKVANG